MKNKNEYEFYNKSQTEQDTIINIAIDLNDDSLDVTKLSNRQTEGIILLSANQKAEDSIHALKKTRIQCGLLNLASTALSAAAVAGFCCHFFQANPLHSIAVGAIASIPFFYSSVKHFDSAYRLKTFLRFLLKSASNILIMNIQISMILLLTQLMPYLLPSMYWKKMQCKELLLERNLIRTPPLKKKRQTNKPNMKT